MGLVVGTRKGVFFLDGDEDRSVWTLSEPHFLGHVAQHVVREPRNGTRLLAARRTGHLGPTVFWSDDRGGSWKITDKKKSTHLVLAIQGELSIPLPGMMKMVVGPVVEAEFEKMVEKYIDNLTAHFGGEV